MPSPFHGRVPGLREAEQVPGSRREVTGQVWLQVTSSSARGRSEVSVGQDRAVSVGGEAGRLLCRRELLWPGAGRAVAWEGPLEGVPDAAHPCCRPLAFLPAAPPGTHPPRRSSEPSSHTGRGCGDLRDAVSVSSSAASRQHTLSPPRPPTAVWPAQRVPPPSSTRPPQPHRSAGPTSCRDVSLLLTPPDPPLPLPR